MHAQRLWNFILSTTLVLALSFALSACVKQASEDADILEDAGTSSGSAIILDPDEEQS